MTKYLLKFYKKGNMRFISHLDLGRLFRRAIKKSEIKVSFSNGFNPHEKINIVQPLSLGYESENEYFEITTVLDYSVLDIQNMLNSSMPEGINFFECKTISEELGNMSNLCDSALYKAVFKMTEEEFNRIDIDAYLAQDQIIVKKRDKKTKTMVDKDVKSLIYYINKRSYSNGKFELELMVRCASNESLNPSNLLNAMFANYNIDFSLDNTIIRRIDLYKINDKKEFISLSNL